MMVNKMQIMHLDPSNPEIAGTGISYGLAPILNTIYEACTLKNSRHTWSLILINMETMIRNCMSAKDIDNGDTLAFVLNDTKVLVHYLLALLDLYSQPGVKPAIVLYIPDYTNIQQTYLRPKLPAGTTLRWSLKEQLRERMADEWDLYDEKVDILCLSQDANNLTWTPKAIINEIDTHLDRHMCRYRNAIMISHMPVDFHIHTKVATFNLLESYTGKYKAAYSLGEKIADAAMPFNKYTHLLFGDKYLLNSLAPPKVRKELIMRAKREVWLKLPAIAVLNIIKRMNFLPLELLTKPDI